MADNPANLPHVTLAEVAAAIDAQLIGDANARACDITHDSRQIAPGWLFVAIKGAIADGHAFIESAIAREVVGIISEQPPLPDVNVAWLQVADARRALARAAACVQHNPSSQLRLVGVTGTNGKTTVAYIVHHIAESTGELAALLGTVERRLGTLREPASHTTPEASDTQRFLRQAVEAGCHTAVMECSSQALDLRRCDALRFAAAVWTNLTQDHLDHHGDMETYYRAKRQLFDGSLGTPPAHSVINIDDPYGRRLLNELRTISNEQTNIITYAMRDDAADVRASEIVSSLGAMRFRLHTPAGGRDVRSPLVGLPMLYNILAATAAALTLGFDLDSITHALETCSGAPGRFEPVAHAGSFAVIVDYAHTPDALANTLRTARDVAPAGRIITIFGCGGDRDRTKRPLMGAAAAEASDLVILTSDNPRTEDPQQIFSDTEQGLHTRRTTYHIMPDRRLAIHEAIREARDGDLVLIAGKGHEDYQIIGTEKLHFDDREVAREALAARVSNAEG